RTLYFNSATSFSNLRTIFFHLDDTLATMFFALIYFLYLSSMVTHFFNFLSSFFIARSPQIDPESQVQPMAIQDSQSHTQSLEMVAVSSSRVSDKKEERASQASSRYLANIAKDLFHLQPRFALPAPCLVDGQVYDVIHGYPIRLDTDYLPVNTYAEQAHARHELHGYIHLRQQDTIHIGDIEACVGRQPAHLKIRCSFPRTQESHNIWVARNNLVQDNFPPTSRCDHICEAYWQHFNMLKS
ncbi:MAG: hypothetical protein ACREHG_08355, partial [Candidatus Saccharimonadales bacterium]